MVTYVFDSSAVIRFLDGEEGIDSVREIFQMAAQSQCAMVVSAVNWGEIVRYLFANSLPQKASASLIHLLEEGLLVIPATAERAAAAAMFRLRHGIGYADCFGIELASAPDHILITADYGAKPAASEVVINFLPHKQQPA